VRITRVIAPRLNRTSVLSISISHFPLGGPVPQVRVRFLDANLGSLYLKEKRV
jgi:hypothetical protein